MNIYSDAILWIDNFPRGRHGLHVHRDRLVAVLVVSARWDRRSPLRQPAPRAIFRSAPCLECFEMGSIKGALRGDCRDLFQLIECIIDPFVETSAENSNCKQTPETEMHSNTMIAAIAAAKKEFSVETADQPDLIREAYELRYQVYCLERSYEAAAGGIETDEYDDSSRHLVLRHRRSGIVIGTGRLVLMNPAAPDDSFPLQRVCDSSFLSGIPRASVAEISRFAISKELRMASPAAQGLLRLSLVRGLVQLSGEAGLTHWCALMQPTLLRLLRASAMHFEAVGPLVELHGKRQPSFTSLDAFLGRVQRDRPAIWDFVTDGGTLWVSPTAASGRATEAVSNGAYGAMGLSA